ncbi:MAG: hypothetical protein HQ486_04680 [Acidimicrobiaceae bacterium]|nr:hypothetical protein [Acidimicrobiaceae bacterium]
MMDHVFSDAIGALRDAFTNAFLERQAFDEHFQSDVLLGDLVWETSYGLPGEGRPPRVVAHITLTWPNWSQATYRAWYTEEVFHESPAIEMEIVFRVQRLANQPDATLVDDITPRQSPQISAGKLERESITVEIARPTQPAGHIDYAIEVTYEGDYELAEESLQDGTSKVLDEHFNTLGGWIASTLIKLGDLQLVYLPADETI